MKQDLLIGQRPESEDFMAQAKCIEGFAVEKRDDNGFLIEDEDFIVDEDSVWDIDEGSSKMISGEVRLTNDEGEWLELPEEMFIEYFEIIE